MSNHILEKTTTSVGFWGWSSFGPIDPEMKIFNEAVGANHVIGNAVYTPETVATQLVVVYR